MAQLQGTETFANLARAFAGETQAGARYQLTAKKAKKEGCTAIETLLKMLAKNEMAHAKVFFDFLTENGTKKFDAVTVDGKYPFKAGVLCDDLAYSAENEQEEADIVYPRFAKTAAAEGFSDIARQFTLIAGIENCHKMQLSEIAELLETDEMYKKKSLFKWKCTECGYEAVQKEAWHICPVCTMPRGAVKVPLSE